jgi:hypothetical protein
MQGWIKLHRKLIEWEWFHQPEMLLVFIYLLLKANHQDGNWQGIPVKKGQLITGRKKLSEETGLSEQKIRGCLNRLKSTSDITIKPTNRFSLITICNYCTYQPDVITVNQPINQPPNQQITNKQPTDNQQITTNNKVKKEKNVKTKTKKPLGFSLTIDSIEKLFATELEPETQYEINTLNKLARYCDGKKESLPNLYSYLIDIIMDLKEDCKVKSKNHGDLMRMFVAKVKKEIK